jgi:ATP-dependent DNA helicase RecG
MGKVELPYYPNVCVFIYKALFQVVLYAWMELRGSEICSGHMVATTVIEVGVNVPNASVMVIESAERFGLSQLHQLRGRVGRGAEKSYCILMTGDKLSKDTLKRIETMVRSSDGFEIAEVDLQLRGPGDLMGTQQSGLLNLKIADLAKDSQLVILARDAARSILEKDPNLSLPEYAQIRSILVDVLKTKPDWGKIA